MNNLLKEDYNILNFENVTKNFEKFIIKGKMFTYEEDLHEEFNNFIKKIYMKNLIILFLWMKKNNQKKK